MQKFKVMMIMCLVLWMCLGCSSNTEAVHFADWDILEPQSEPIYQFSSEDRGSNGDGTDSYVYELTGDYRDYLMDKLSEKGIMILTFESMQDLPVSIADEIYKVEDEDILETIHSFSDFSLAIVGHNDDTLYILMDQDQAQIVFIFSLS